MSPRSSLRRIQLQRLKNTTLEGATRHQHSTLHGKLLLTREPRDVFPEVIAAFRLDYVLLSDETIYAMQDLPLIHRDPFDRLLIATARILDLPIITVDPIFKEYPVEVLW